MKRRPDPKRLAARAELDRATLRLHVLTRGFGGEMERGYYGELLDLLLEFLHEDLEPAIERVKRAERVYGPYWRRRVRRVSAPRPKKAKAR